MKKLFKRLYRTSVFRQLVCWLVAGYIRLVYYTSRRTSDIEEGARPYMEGKLPAIFAFWHARLLMMPMMCPPGRKMHVLISTHRDGEVISSAMHNFGFSTIRGSSTRGGGTAAIKAVKALQAGDNVSITPDGPRGPAMQVQQGIITISEMAQMPVLYAAYSATRHRRMKSWDRFMLALPFSKLYYKVGILHSPVTKEILEASMVKVTEEVDSKAHA